MTRFVFDPEENVLVNNQTLYDVGDDWFKILLRMAYIPDKEIYFEDPDVLRYEMDYEVEYEPPEEVDLQPLYNCRPPNEVCAFSTG
jgi:hypothetical protein